MLTGSLARPAIAASPVGTNCASAATLRPCWAGRFPVSRPDGPPVTLPQAVPTQIVAVAVGTALAAQPTVSSGRQG